MDGLVGAGGAGYSRRAMTATPANALTLLRLLLAPMLVWAIARDAAVAASLVFALAVASDFADGWLARRAGEASLAGGLFDHAVDAVFVTSGSAALAFAGVLPGVLPVLIAAAFAQYALDSSLFATRGVHPLPLGRWNGIAYYVIVAIPVVRDAIGLGWPPPSWVEGLAWGIVATTALSMGDRARLLLSTRSGAAAPSE